MAVVYEKTKILTDTPDIDQILVRRVERRRIADALSFFDQAASGKVPYGFLCLFDAHRLLCPDRDRNGMRPHNRNADAGAGNEKLRPVQDAASLILHLHLFRGIQIVQPAADPWNHI